MFKKIVSIVLGVALVAALAVIPWADNSTYYPLTDGAWEVFEACYQAYYPEKDAPMTVEEMRTAHGDVAAQQYTGMMNYYYDTGAWQTLYAASKLLDEAEWENVAENETPLFNRFTLSDTYLHYVPGSEAPEETTKEIPFADVDPDAWYAEAVAALADSGIIIGGDDGLFHPDDTVTVAEWCTMLLRAGSREGGDPVAGHTTGRHWGSAIVSNASSLYLGRFWLAESSFVDGERPEGLEDEPVNRGEAIEGVSMLHRWGFGENPGVTLPRHYRSDYAARWTYRHLTSGQTTKTWELSDIPDYDVVTGDHDVTDEFNNGKQSHCWDSQEILRALNKGLVHGTDANGTMEPLRLLTRAEAVQLLYNAGFVDRSTPALVDNGPGWDFFWKGDTPKYNYA